MVPFTFLLVLLYAWLSVGLMQVCVGLVGWRNDAVVVMLILTENGLSHRLVSLSYRTVYGLCVSVRVCILVCKCVF